MKRTKPSNQPIRQISPSRNYWFIRTVGGKYYDVFKEQNYIAVGWNEVKLFQLIDLDRKNKSGIQELGKKIKQEKKEEPSKHYGTKSVRQMLKFVHDIRKGDIVVIPDVNSDTLNIGEVLETPVHLASGLELEKCRFEKRKKVKWLKTVSLQNRLHNPYLYQIKYSQQTVNNLNIYASFIEREIQPLYIANGKGHVVFKLKTKEAVDFEDFHAFYELVDMTLDVLEADKQNELDYGRKDVQLKMNMNSPGEVVVLAEYLEFIYVFVILVILAVGGQVKLPAGIEVRTKGAIKRINDFKNDATHRAKLKILNKKLDNMELDKDSLKDLLGKE